MHGTNSTHPLLRGTNELQAGAYSTYAHGAATPLPTQLAVVAVVMLTLHLTVSWQWLQLPSAAPSVCMPIGPLPNSCAAAVDSADTTAADAGAGQLLLQGVSHTL